MGGDQHLAAVMAGACCLAIECERDADRFPPPHPLRRRKGAHTGRSAFNDRRWTKAGEAKSVGLLGNAAEIFPNFTGAACGPIW